MFNKCGYCQDIHLFNCCHKGLQLVRFMKRESDLLSLSMNELRWLCSYFKQKTSNKKHIMIKRLTTLDINSRLEDCPICYEEMSLNSIVITPCAHAYCDKCILTYMQENDQCPLCRSSMNIIYLLLIIPKKRVCELYREIYTICNTNDNHSLNNTNRTDYNNIIHRIYRNKIMIVIFFIVSYYITPFLI